MASPSSSSVSKHDVFLSFRGKDTRDNIISHLLKALETTKIPTFSDYELNRGDEISPALLKAIEESKISVIIFSENYADSEWCLNELLKILECRKELNQIVIPVFYKVEPTDVRNQTGKFGAAFLQIAALESGKEQIWRNALRDAANLPACESSSIGSMLCRSEATLVDTIMADVLKKLEMGSNNSYDATGLLGINSRIEQIVCLLRIIWPEFRIVGIWGIGGIGKTTIAQAVYNKISCQFESCCFVENVGVKAKTREGLASLRGNLFSKLLKIKKSASRLPYTWHRLRRTRVLIVLDDVDHISQIDCLTECEYIHLFGPGSRVIVISKDKQILRYFKIEDVYDMEILDDNDAFELFNHFASGKNQPLEHYLNFSKKMIEYAKGVPLALKVLGSSLRRKTSLSHWEDALKRLSNVPDTSISDVLKISYDSLEDEEKNISRYCMFLQT